MTRDWSKPNLRNAYKPVPPAFDQAVSTTLQLLQTTDERKHINPKRMVVFAALCLLLVGMTVAYTVARPAILRWLLGYGNGSSSLEQTAQNILAENSADHITARINGVVYDGYQFAFSYELENDQPDQPVLVAVDSGALVDGQLLGLNVDMYDPKMVPDPRADVLPVRRNPTDGGGWSLPFRKELSGDVTCEVTFIVYRPVKSFVVISAPYHLEEYDADVQAEILDSWNTLRGFQNILIADSADNDPEKWSREGYTVIDSSGMILGSAWNVRETARIPVTFTFHTDTAIAYDFSDTKDVDLTDCTLHVRRLRFSPLTTIVDISLIPHKNSQAAAQELAKRYGTIELVDENGVPLLFADMDYEYSPLPFVTAHWGDNGCWACTYSIEMPGLQAWPERISLITEQGALLRVSLP